MMNRFALARKSKQFQDKLYCYRNSKQTSLNSLLTLYFDPSQDNIYYNVFFRSPADIRGKTGFFAGSGMGFSEIDIPMKDWAAYLQHIYSKDRTIRIVLPEGFDYDHGSKGEEIAAKIRSANRWKVAGITLVVLASLVGITRTAYQSFIYEPEKQPLVQELIDNGQLNPSLLENKIDQTNSAGIH